MKLSRRNAGPLAAMLLCSTSVPTFAQSAGGMEEIVVTARRRAENIQNVPSTIQAISAESLVTRGIQSDADLQSTVPGLTVRAGTFNGLFNYSIRGELNEAYSGSVPGVQSYFNEVALSGVAATAFYDVQGVQVLKGPQGTLFGRNSTGGAVLFQTVQPTHDFGGFVSAQYGNHDRLVIEGAVNVPVSDKVALRLAGQYTSGGAFVRNLYNNTMSGDSKNKSGRATLLIEPSDTFKNVTMVQYSESKGTNTAGFPYYYEPCGGTGNDAPCWARAGNAFFDQAIRSAPGTYFPGWPNGYVWPGGIPGLRPFLESQGKYVVNDDGILPYESKDTLVINTTTFELSDTMTLKNTFGYGHTDRSAAYDNDGTAIPFLKAGGGLAGGSQLEQRINETFSNELQLQGKAMDGRLDVIVGGFFSRSETENNSPITGFGYVAAFNVPYTFALRYRNMGIDKSWAAFTQATYAVTDKLNITGGIRGTWDTLTAYQLPFSSFYPGHVQQAKQSDVSWTVTVDYKITPDLMVYATQRGSWRVGGYNGFVAPVGMTTTAENGGNYFVPEKVRDVEAGVKYSGRIGDTPVRLNADIFNLWVKNSQKTAYIVVAGNITSVTNSVPAGQVRGFEFDGQIQPTDWLTLGGNFSYNFAKYTNGRIMLYGTPNVFGPYADTPRYTGSVFADITHPLSGNSGTLRYHVDLYAQSYFHLSSSGNTFQPGDKIRGYALLNMRLDWQDPLGVEGLTASIFAKNLTDKVYFTGGSANIQLYGTHFTNFGQPRMFGGVLRYDF